MKRMLLMLCLSGLFPALAGCGARQGNAAELPTNTVNPPATAPIEQAPPQKLKVPPK